VGPKINPTLQIFMGQLNKMSAGRDKMESKSNAMRAGQPDLKNEGQICQANN
jgi:hypothetical protein